MGAEKTAISPSSRTSWCEGTDKLLVCSARTCKQKKNLDKIHMSWRAKPGDSEVPC